MKSFLLFCLIAFAAADYLDVLLNIERVDNGGDPVRFYKYSYDKCYIQVLGASSVMYKREGDTIRQYSHLLNSKCSSSITYSTDFKYNDDSSTTGYKTKSFAPIHVAFINSLDDSSCSNKDDMERLYYGTGCFDTNYRYKVDEIDGEDYFIKYHYSGSGCEGDKTIKEKTKCDTCTGGLYLQCGTSSLAILLVSIIVAFFL